MNREHKRDRWLEDVNNRQRNVVFPDTVQNEARFWRNLQDSPWKTSTAVGMVILAIFVATLLTVFLVATLQAHALWALALVMLLVWGPFFAVLAWATRRTLQNIEKSRHGRRVPRR